MKRSVSGGSSHPRRSKKIAKRLDDLRQFAKDLQASVNNMVPTGGRRFTHAAILAIEFAVTDIPGVRPLRAALLKLLQDDYGWTVESYTIPCNCPWKIARRYTRAAVQNFVAAQFNHPSSEPTLLCLYFSGHGFQGSNQELQICGSMSGSAPNKPYFSWEDITEPFNKELPNSPKDHKLVLMDCCAAGLANLAMSDVEVIGASSWESIAPQSPQASFTQAIIDELRKVSPAPISATQLVSRLHSTQSVVKNRSMPVHKFPVNLDKPPAVIHRIEKTTTPPPTQSTAVPRFSHVLIGVTVEKEDTIPDKAAWATWLTTNLPPYVGQIDIQASWKTGSAFVIFVMPIEIWLGLPEREAYVFLEYHRGWDAAAAARAQRALCHPPPPTRGTGRGVGRGMAEQSSSQLRGDENVRPGTGTGRGAGIPQRMPQPGHETPLDLLSPNVPRPDEQKDSR